MTRHDFYKFHGATFFLFYKNDTPKKNLNKINKIHQMKQQKLEIKSTSTPTTTTTIQFNISLEKSHDRKYFFTF